MVHQYQLNGYNIVLDTCSGSVHVVDDVAYDVIAMYQDHTADQIVSAMMDKYGSRPDVTEEDLRQPYQRSLGRRTAVVMAPCCTMALGALALSAGEAFGSAPLSTLGTVVLFASGAVVLALVVWLLAWSARQTRRQQDEAVANDPSKAEDVRLDRRAGIVLAVIVGGLIVIELVVVPLLAR